jgi:hypothetical protein
MLSAPVWQLSSPAYEGGDAESAHTNGELEWLCDMPSFDCAACRRSRSCEDERQVPLWLSEADADLVGSQEDFGTPEDYDAFMGVLAQRVAVDSRNEAFVRTWRDRRTIVPMPVMLRIPSAPLSAVLHPSGEILIRADVAAALEAMSVRGAVFSPVARVEVIGTRRSPPSVKFVPGPARPASEARHYTLLSVTEVTGVPVGVTRRHCSRCRRVVDEWRERRLALPPSGWREGLDLACLATTHQVLVSDRVKRVLERDLAPNVAFELVSFC